MDVNKKFKLDAVIAPENSTYQNFIWTSSNPEIIKVTDDNEFLSIKEGKATITVCNEEGVEASIEISVTHKSKVYGFGFGCVLLLGGLGGVFRYKKGLLNKLKK